MVSQGDNARPGNSLDHVDSPGGSQGDSSPAGDEHRHVDAQLERALAAIAGRQHAIVARSQLSGLGLSASAIDNWLQRGRLHLMHRGVYALVPRAAQPPLAPEFAAVRACGERAFLSHLSSAAVWRLIPATGLVPSGGPAAARGQVRGTDPIPAGHERQAALHVTVAGPHRRPRPGIHLHRVEALHRRDVTEHERIPISTPARAVVELAAWLPARELERALDQAVVLGLCTREAVRRALHRAPGRKGTAVLRAIASVDGPTTITRSQAEERFMGLVRRGRLPRPETNVRTAGYELDFLWRDARLVVEIDGYAFHSSRAAFERDRRRDLALQAVGFRVLRISWHQLTHEPEAVLVRVAQTLTPSQPA